MVNIGGTLIDSIFQIHNKRNFKNKWEEYTYGDWKKGNF